MMHMTHASPPRSAKIFGSLVSVMLMGGALLVQPGLAYADDDDEVVATDDAEDATVDGGYADTDPSAVTAFQSDLSPYGTWVDDGVYGTVWVPNGAVVGADFAPYQSSGHWALTDDGQWLWVSDYSWGYIPFHYGRWLWIDGRGWSWIPGRAYAPSWVVWRTGADGYIGWAPMPPAYYWSDGVYVDIVTPVPAAFVFVDSDDVFDHDVRGHVYRDRASVQRAVDGTHPYRASGGMRYAPAYPSLKDAHLVKATPKYEPANEKALALSRPTSHALSGSFSGGGATNIRTLQRSANPAPSAVRGSASAAPRGVVRSSTSQPAAARTVQQREVTPEPRPAVRQISRQPAPQQTLPERTVTRPQPEPAPVHVSNPRPAPQPAFHPAPAAPHPVAAPASRPAAAPAPMPAPVHHSSPAPVNAGGGRHR